MLSDRVLRWLFLTVAALQIVPVWSAPYLPTNDGPCHLYNSWILQGLATHSAGGTIASYYAIDWRPHPNWMSHAAMALLLFVVPPLVAEKLLVSAIIIIFLAGAWMFAGAADPSGHAWAFVALPFTFHLLLQTGFYNFALGVGLFMMTVAVWWRRRDTPDARTIALVAALLLLCYFSHAMAVVLAAFSIGVLWLINVRRATLRDQLRHAIAFIPVGALLVWFVAHRGTGSAPDPRGLMSRLGFLARSQVLFTFDSRQLALGWIVSIVLAVLLIATLVRENIEHGRLRVSARDGFLLLFVIFIAIYLAAPGGFAGGTMISERMALFVELSLLPWISPRLTRLRMPVVAVMVVLAVLNVALNIDRYRAFSREMAQLVRTAELVAPNSTVLPFVFDHGVGKVGYMSHAIDYAAIGKRFIDLDNYEPAMDYFPLRYRKGVDVPGIDEVEAAPLDIDLSAQITRARFLLTWSMPPIPGLVTRIDRDYRLVASAGSGRVYERRMTEAAVMEMMERESSYATILLPLAGTRSDVALSHGATWRVEQSVTNTGHRPVHLMLNACAFNPSCEVDLQPGQSAPIASNDSLRPYTLVRAPPGDANLLSFSTMLLRGDSGFQLALPAIDEPQMRPRRVEFANVPLSPRVRVALRVWAFKTPRPPVRYTVHVQTPDGRDIVARNFATGRDGFQLDGNLVGEFPAIEGRDLRANVVVEFGDAQPRDARIWAMLTVTDNAT
ncbi:MAG TPA: hypothetical protein VF980_05325, partial [Thermoanaerobaculia bacterium]